MIGIAAEDIQRIPRQVGKVNFVAFSRHHQRVNEGRQLPGRRPASSPPRRPRPPSRPWWLPVAIGGFLGIMIILLVLWMSGPPTVVAPETPTPEPAAVAMVPSETVAAVPATHTALPPPTATAVPPTDTPVPATVTRTPTPGPDAVVVADTLNVRAGPGTSYDILAQVHKGDTLTINGQNAGGDWVQVITGTGREGWVATSLLQVNVDLALVSLVKDIPPPPTPQATPEPAEFEVDFFFHYWCDACQAQARDFERLAQSYRSAMLHRDNRPLAVAALSFVLPPIQEEPSKVDFYLVPLSGSAAQNASFQKKYARSVPLRQNPGLRSRYDMSVHPVVIGTHKGTGVSAVLSRGRTGYSPMSSGLNKFTRGESFTPGSGWT